MSLFALMLLITQFCLLGVFSIFAFFNYLYSLASLRKPLIRRVPHSNNEIAVVIVSFNEKYVLEQTIEACNDLTYQNKITVLADDSTDLQILESLRHLAKSKGCKKVDGHQFTLETTDINDVTRQIPIEIWESPDFVFFHRPNNTGFKAGSLQKVHEYLEQRGIDYMYVLDADWHPQKDVLERTLEVLEADTKAAFVQTKRISSPEGMNAFQRYITLNDEGCYYVDNEGREVLGHPVLFTGCCTLLRLDAIKQVGGFTPGHLTEDLDLSTRLWLSGLKGIYLGDVINYGEVPFTYDHFRKQQERWAAGSARCFREFFWPILTTSKLNTFQKLSALRQNAYFTTALLTLLAIVTGILTIAWLSICWNTYPVEYYLYLLGMAKGPFVFLVYFCILSNLAEPLVMILWKKRTYRDLFHLPMMVWTGWSVLHSCISGNIKGLFNLKLDWFRTPKFVRNRVGILSGTPVWFRTLNIFTLVAFLCFYFMEGWVFGWFDKFSLLLIPAFLLASIR